MTYKKSISSSYPVKSKFSFRIILGFGVVIMVFLFGVLNLYFGIKDTYQLNKKTRNYITTDGYFKSYDIYENNESGIMYKLTYVYRVGSREYFITTNYKTNYIPSENSIREVMFNPNNPNEAVLVGINDKSSSIFIGAFFTIVSLVFILIALSVTGCFDRFKVDIIGIYIGIVFFSLGIGIIIFQNSTTMSLLETIKSFGLWILIPLLFIVVGIFLFIKCLFYEKNMSSKKKK